MSRVSVKEFKKSLKLSNTDNTSAGALLTYFYCNEKYPYVNIHGNPSAKTVGSYENIIKWLISNVNDEDWEFVPGAIFFTHDEDAVAFKLVWA